MVEVESRNAWWLNPWLAVLGLIALTAWVYAPVTEFEFVQWDDNRLILENEMMSQGLTPETGVWALTAIVIGNWAPVAWLSHLVDVSLYGLAAPGHHVTSVIFHVANTCLLFLGLSALTGFRARSLVVAALFAIHPLHVESVAWVAERRDVLSLFFALLTMGAHARWVRDRNRFIYCLGLLFLALGLASKAMLVSVPLLLLMMDYWPLRRRSESILSLLVEKIPHVMLAGLSSLITLGTQSKVPALPLFYRVSNAIESLWIYLGQMVWPQNLAVLYPHPIFPGGAEPIGPIGATIGALLLAAISGVVVWMRKRPYLAVGWFWYVVSLLPVIGLVQVGQHAHADRYTYLPSIGIFIALTWAGAEVLQALRRDRMQTSRVAAIVIAVLIGGYAFAARQQVGHWRNTITLFEHATNAVPGNFQMHYNLALHFKDAGDVDRSIENLEKAVEINPTMSRAHYNLGNAYSRREQWDQAITHYTEAAKDETKLQRSLRGLIKSSRARDGNLNVVIDFLEQRTQGRPEFARDHVMLGQTHQLNGNLEAAIEAYRAASALEPDNDEIRNLLTDAKEALDELETAPNAS